MAEVLGRFSLVAGSERREPQSDLGADRDFALAGTLRLLQHCL